MRYLMKLALGTQAGLYSVNKVTAIIASIVLAAMMLLTVGDVVGRYGFNRPIRGANELVGLLLVCAGTWGWGYCQMGKGHISVDIIIERLPQMSQTILKSVAYILGLAGFSLICWQMLLTAIRYISLTRGGLTEILKIPSYPFMIVLTIGAGLMALILLIDLLHSLAEVARK